MIDVVQHMIACGGMMRTTILAVGALLATTAFCATDDPNDRVAGLLFHEGFDDGRLVERGWYDGAKFEIARDGAHSVFAIALCVLACSPGTQQPFDAPTQPIKQEELDRITTKLSELNSAVDK